MRIILIIILSLTVLGCGSSKVVHSQNTHIATPRPRPQIADDLYNYAVTSLGNFGHVDSVNCRRTNFRARYSGDPVYHCSIIVDGYNEATPNGSFQTPCWYLDSLFNYAVTPSERIYC